MDGALKIFDSINDSVKDIICINCMMSTYICNGFDKIAMELFDKCIDGRYSKVKLHNNVSNMLAIKACTTLGNFEKGKNIISNMQYSNKEIQLKSTLIDFYGNCLEIENAMRIFNTINDKNKDIISIAAMMNAYCLSNLNKEAIQLFMKYFIDNTHLKLVPDRICYSIFFDVCTNSTSLYFGQQIHDKLKTDTKSGFILSDTEIQTKIINMYGKCGSLQKCKDMFENIKNKNEISVWNAMMHSFGRNGEFDECMQFFNKIKMNDRLVP
eukprot:484246_1